MTRSAARTFAMEHAADRTVTTQCAVEPLSRSQDEGDTSTARRLRRSPRTPQRWTIAVLVVHPRRSRPVKIARRPVLGRGQIRGRVAGRQFLDSDIVEVIQEDRRGRGPQSTTTTLPSLAQ